MTILVLLLSAIFLQSVSAIDPISTLECHRRQYSYKVQQTDSNGNLCWDHVNVMSCWGRCDSNEIADWKFPFKRSHHPVCLHESTQERKVVLRNCDIEVDPKTRVYTFQEAASCACILCKSSEASCEGLRYRGARRAPRQTTKKSPAKRTNFDRSFVEKYLGHKMPNRDLLQKNYLSQNAFYDRSLAVPKSADDILRNLILNTDETLEQQRVNEDPLASDYSSSLGLLKDLDLVEDLSPLASNSPISLYEASKRDKEFPHYESE